MESVDAVLAQVMAALASMEPWHFSHGEVRRSTPPCAAPTLQWSHGILAMESGAGNSFEAGAVMLQWSHGILAMERSHRLDGRRNRASASMEPWHFSHGEFAPGLYQGHYPELASMEPWHFSHGEGWPDRCSA